MTRLPWACCAASRQPSSRGFETSAWRHGATRGAGLCCPGELDCGFPRCQHHERSGLHPPGGGTTDERFASCPPAHSGFCHHREPATHLGRERSGCHDLLEFIGQLGTDSSRTVPGTPYLTSLTELTVQGSRFLRSGRLKRSETVGRRPSMPETVISMLIQPQKSTKTRLKGRRLP